MGIVELPCKLSLQIHNTTSVSTRAKSLKFKLSYVVTSILNIWVITLTPLMFGKTKLITPYFQQMTPRSKILKIIHIALQK
jgi:hypothetical protein